MNSGIYRIKNLITDKSYYGSAINFNDRWKIHLSLLRNNKHHSNHLQNSWNKHKEQNFVFEIVELCEKENLLIFEQGYLDLFKTWHKQFGYNICKIAGSRLGSKHTNEWKIAKSSAMKGSIPWNKGKHPSFETLKKQSEAQLGNKSHMFGKSHSIETKLKISKSKNNIKKAVERIDFNTGIVKIYESALLAEKDGFDHGHISSCCNGKRKSHKGFYWKYLNIEDDK